MLRLDVPELAALPWEAMYDPGTGGYVCRQHQLVRHVPVAAVPPPLEIHLPLRVLGVVSAPRGLPALDSAKEREQLTRALAGLVAQDLAELVWAPLATWDGLHEMLLSGPWHVLHFIGHGGFDPDRDEGILAFAREEGSPDLVEASRFASLLRQARPMPRLVVLNSCSGAVTSQDDLFSGTAAALARNGVAAVTAMQYTISDSAAVAFTRGFYAALAHGRGVDEAVSAGRIGILGTSGSTLEWITPVIYLRGDAAHLFTFPPTDKQKRVPQQVPQHPPTSKSDDVGEAARELARIEREREYDRMRPVLEGRIFPWPGLSDGRDYRLEIWVKTQWPLTEILLNVPGNAWFTSSAHLPPVRMDFLIQFPEPGRRSAPFRPSHPASCPVRVATGAHGKVTAFAKCRNEHGVIWEDIEVTIRFEDIAPDAVPSAARTGNPASGPPEDLLPVGSPIVLRGGPADGREVLHAAHPGDYVAMIHGVRHVWRHTDPQAWARPDRTRPVYDYVGPG